MVYLQQFKKFHNFSPNRFSPTEEIIIHWRLT
jgi:hypothetical protein